jgi:putative FmdB family regulatory protein
MPTYTYRREDGTTFDLRQSFSDEPLTTDPETGQAVVRVVQAAPVIFKGSGFYVNDSRGKTSTAINKTSKHDAPGDTAAAAGSAPSAPAASEAPAKLTTQSTAKPTSAAAD